MSDASDRSGQQHAGEELDIAAVDAWLKRQLPALQGAPQVTQYSGGASNWTYRLEYANDDLILRRPPAGRKAKGAHDMGREYRIQAALSPVFPYVPAMRAMCADESVIGAEFYVMQRIAGLIPRKSLPPGMTLSPAQARTLCTNALDVLIALHRVDYRATDLAAFDKGSGYARRQVEGWSRRFRDVPTWNVMRGEDVMAWLAANIPATEHLCFTHNDFRFDNLVLDTADPTRILGVLDWELATVGDPLIDLANTLTYWIQADDDFFARSLRRQPTHLPGMLTRAEVLHYYCEQTGMRPENWTFYEVYAGFRLAVIAQQIYYRYHHGQSRNRAFRHFWLWTNYQLWRCRRAIRRDARR